jgi:hypothetical protein
MIRFNDDITVYSPSCRHFIGQLLKGKSFEESGILFFAMKEKKKNTELEFLKSLWGLGTEEEKGYRTGPPGT